jgi:flagellar hook-length control protein FliK
MSFTGWSNLLAGIGANPSSNAGSAAANAWRDANNGANGNFARELMQAQAPVAPPPVPMPAPAPAPAQAARPAAAPPPPAAPRPPEPQPTRSSNTPADNRNSTTSSTNQARARSDRADAERRDAARSADAVDDSAASVDGEDTRSERHQAEAAGDTDDVADDALSGALPAATDASTASDRALSGELVAGSEEAAALTGAQTLGGRLALRGDASDTVDADPSAAAAAAVDGAAGRDETALRAASRHTRHSHADLPDSVSLPGAPGGPPGTDPKFDGGSAGAGGDGGLLGDMAGSGKAATAAAATAAGAALPTFAAELARNVQSGSLAGAQAAAGSPTELQLATPMQSPEFAPRLGGELSLLARNGVQEARVHINPAELGPIAVQISVDGSNAQVSLAADNAQTRTVLEQAMPALAAALRESGLTLTGGGVFQNNRQAARDGQAGGSASGGQGRGSGRSSDGDDAVRATSAPRRTVLPGAVDLYA